MQLFIKLFFCIFKSKLYLNRMQRMSSSIRHISKIQTYTLNILYLKNEQRLWIMIAASSSLRKMKPFAHLFKFCVLMVIFIYFFFSFSPSRFTFHSFPLYVKLFFVRYDLIYTNKYLLVFRFRCLFQLLRIIPPSSKKKFFKQILFSIFLFSIVILGASLVRCFHFFLSGILSKAKLREHKWIFMAK